MNLHGLMNNKQHGTSSKKKASWSFLSIIQQLPGADSQSTMDWIFSDIIKIKSEILFHY